MVETNAMLDGIRLHRSSVNEEKNRNDNEISEGRSTIIASRNIWLPRDNEADAAEFFEGGGFAEGRASRKKQGWAIV